MTGKDETLPGGGGEYDGINTLAASPGGGGHDGTNTLAASLGGGRGQTPWCNPTTPSRQRV